MLRQLLNGTETVPLLNRSIRKAYLQIEYQHVDDATTQGVNLSACNISVEVSQRGVNKNVNFQALPAYSRYQAYEASINGSNVINPILPSVCVLGDVIDERTVGADSIVTRQLIVPILDFPYVLNGDDKINLTVQQLSGLFGAGNTSSIVYLCVEDGTDLTQEAIILPTFVPITDNRTDVSEDLSMTNEVALIGTGVSTLSTSLNPFTSATIRSLHYNDEMTVTQLMRKAIDINIRANAINYFPVFKKDGLYLKQAVINLSVNTSLVVAGATWLFYNSITPNPMLMERALLARQRHDSSKINDLL